MGIGHRFFIIDESENIIKFPFAKYERLFQKNSAERLPQFKSSRIRYVYANLNTENRKPVSIWRIEYCYVTLDEEGRVDWERFEEELADGMACLEDAFADSEKDNGNIINAKRIFREKKRRDRNFWEPSEELEKKIYDLIFPTTEVKKKKRMKKIRVDISTDLELPPGWEVVEQDKYGTLLKYKQKFYEFDMRLISTKSLDGVISWEDEDQMDEELRSFFISQTIGIEELK